MFFGVRTNGDILGRSPARWEGGRPQGRRLAVRHCSRVEGKRRTKAPGGEGALKMRRSIRPMSGGGSESRSPTERPRGPRPGDRVSRRDKDRSSRRRAGSSNRFLGSGTGQEHPPESPAQGHPESENPGSYSQPVPSWSVSQLTGGFNSSECSNKSTRSHAERGNECACLLSSQPYSQLCKGTTQVVMETEAKLGGFAVFAVTMFKPAWARSMIGSSGAIPSILTIVRAF
jgi:hypothetical protein